MADKSPATLYCERFEQKRREEQAAEKKKREDQQKLWDLCESFAKDNKIYDRETIYDCDRVIENSYVFMDKIFEIVGLPKDPDN